ncbi:dethiobiotin synthase [Caulobacter mirabilis]|uniref:ATP-dependent dethiobiotin synthetase BioD n=1 Tax=Caulobacter mirabilis TaxID=69666 RepID=A0A2D2AVM7_9CAUL|nr:dethiobiotin synthase [Caulobacter mirabilis]ATQ42053.1 dethiobiotin synthase [Caulobacter mirabilis]
MRTFFVAGGGTDVGKTHVTALLVRALRRAGKTVAVLKPVASGYDPAHPEESDAGRLLAALDIAPTPEAIHEICPLRFAEPLSPPAAARREGVALELATFVDLCQARIAAEPAEVLLIEGVGGLMSPLTDRETGLDLMAALGVPTILVGGTYLGGISHMLTAYEVLHARVLTVAAVVASESPPPAPDFVESVADMGRFLGGTPLLAADRAGRWQADDLAALLLA